jgi:hypothetical protein
MDPQQQQAWERAVERKKEEAREASQHPDQRTPAMPDVTGSEQPGVRADSSNSDQPTPHHKSQRHGQVTAENWNQ